MTKEIAEYAAREYTGAGDFRQAMQDLQFRILQPPQWTPAHAQAPTLPETEDFKLRYKEYYDKKTKREENQKKVFALVLGQCVETIEAHVPRRCTKMLLQILLILIKQSSKK